ncbi:WXG100 family type VII secretion target [Actinoplanes sp. M2I2]|uniref:WXG100 family type VII secretion target n=1 Tax=Actinoplanes sp. M2I2 TaxID=1734444 RepID=UPI0020202D45|nr:WXG100 family type VII secretion target [Actinoplanes sp. M2I2]
MPGQMILDPEEVKAFAQYLLQQRENLQSALQEADTRMAETVEASYNTPGSESKFKPFWEEYITGTKQAIDGIEGVSQFLDQTLQKFVETDDATAGAIG